jgi:phosphogluconate dehydratase
MGGPLARLRDGDILRIDAQSGTLMADVAGLDDRAAATPDLAGHQHGIGRELFANFRQTVGPATEGASALF